jgi:outer membrane protein, multidrug efflux system
MQALCGRLAGIVGVLALLATVGCAARARQPYVPPPIEAPAEWSGGRPSEPELEVLASWWLTFGDKVLTSLVTRAVGANLDLRSAVSRLRQARASLDIARRDLRPTADVGVGAAASGTGEGSVSEFYRLGFDASWELDVFGGIRSTVDASTATVGAREADEHLEARGRPDARATPATVRGQSAPGAGTAVRAAQSSLLRSARAPRHRGGATLS